MSRGFLYLTLVVTLFPKICDADTQGLGSDPPPEGDTKPSKLSFPAEVPWSASALVFPESDDQASLVAAMSHAGNAFEIWSVEESRSADLVKKFEDVGYHPDSIYWVDWADNAGRETVLILVVEGDREIQLWRLGDDLELTKSSVFPTVYPPRDIDIGDIDADGFSDIVVGSYDDRPLQVLRGRGDFTFDSLLLETEGVTLHPRFVDWNLDDRIDIVWSAYRDKDGKIQVALQKDYPSDDQSVSSALTPDANKVDEGVDQDDAVKSSKTGVFEITTLWSREISTLPEPLKFAPRPRIAVPADLNGDEFPDLIVATELAGGALVLYNDGEGGIEEAEIIPAEGDGYNWVAVLSEADIPLVAMADISGIVLAQRQDDGWQQQHIKLGEGLLVLDVDFADIDNDGHQDLIFANVVENAVQIVFGPLWKDSSVSPEN